MASPGLQYRPEGLPSPKPERRFSALTTGSVGYPVPLRPSWILAGVGVMSSVGLCSLTLHPPALSASWTPRARSLTDDSAPTEPSNRVGLSPPHPYFDDPPYAAQPRTSPPKIFPKGASSAAVAGLCFGSHLPSQKMLRHGLRIFEGRVHLEQMNACPLGSCRRQRKPKHQTGWILGSMGECTLRGIAFPAT